MDRMIEQTVPSEPVRRYSNTAVAIHWITAVLVIFQIWLGLSFAAMAAGPERGLAAIDRIDGLEGYVHYHSARAGLLRRAGRDHEAREAYRRALDLDPGEAERRFLERQLSR